MGQIVWAVAVFLVLAGLYLFLAGSVDVIEATGMVVCAAAGTALFVATEIVAKRTYTVLPPPKAVFRPLGALVPELAIVGRELIATILTGATRERGMMVEQPFAPGTDDPRDSARRALTVVGVSLAPRTFVVQGERTRTLLLHALPSKPASADHTWPA